MSVFSRPNIVRSVTVRPYPGGSGSSPRRVHCGSGRTGAVSEAVRAARVWRHNEERCLISGCYPPSSQRCYNLSGEVLSSSDL